jgi:hypothetical protein
VTAALHIRNVLFLLVAGVALWLCTVSASCLGSQEPQAVTPAATASAPGQDDVAAGFFDDFPSKSYTSFEEAESVAGFRIPRAGEAYPVGFGLTHLQWFPGNDMPVSHTEYAYTPQASTSIGIAVGPASLWALKDGTRGEEVLTRGDPTTIGDKQGFGNFGETLWLFNFRCGSTGAEDVWCVVRAHSKVGRQGFDEFVSSIHQ